MGLGPGRQRRCSLLTPTIPCRPLAFKTAINQRCPSLLGIVHTHGCRFTDVKQLFYQAQREAQLAASAGKGWDEAAVQMPDIVPLEVNYRTHRWGRWLEGYSRDLRVGCGCAVE